MRRLLLAGVVALVGACASVGEPSPAPDLGAAVDLHPVADLRPAPDLCQPCSQVIILDGCPQAACYHTVNDGGMNSYCCQGVHP